MFLAKFRFSAFFLVYSVIIYTEVHSEVFFFDDEMIIHSKKNIENFYVTLQALSELVQHIKGTVRWEMLDGAAGAGGRAFGGLGPEPWEFGVCSVWDSRFLGFHLEFALGTGGMGCGP